jgi:hypothetical protein
MSFKNFLKLAIILSAFVAGGMFIGNAIADYITDQVIAHHCAAAADRMQAQDQAA